ncbi:hypothetical protein V7S43_011821 [Phytophthora oleae]|uniref:Uncharacterized protein n=1 Tax=Phytophthora oleae TaxID=2107226 RepID=A0ABD3FCJ1_9STRA
MSTGESEICVLGDNFTERYGENHQSEVLDKKFVLLRFGGSRRVFSHRRRQFLRWKSHTATNAVKTLRGCYTLARQELASWRSHSEAESAEQQANEFKKSGPNATRAHSTRTTPRDSTVSSVSTVRSMASSAEPEEERIKAISSSEFSLRSRSQEMKRTCSFAETTSGHEAVPVIDSDDDNGEIWSTSDHLPFRSTVVDGRTRLLHNEWV